MILNFNAYKAFIEATNSQKSYIFTDCSKNLINDVINRNLNKDSITINLPISELYIDDTIDTKEQQLYQRIIAFLITREILEIFLELDYDLILAGLISSKDTKALLSSLIQKIKDASNLNININFFITEGISNALQRAINDYMSDELPFHSRIYTVYNDLITYRKSDGTLLDTQIYSLNNIKVNSKKNSFKS